MNNSKKLLFGLICAAWLVLCSGCKDATIIILYPGFNSLAQHSIDRGRVNSAYESAIRELLAEDRKGSKFENLHLKNIKFIQHDKVYREFKREGVTTLKKCIGDDYEVAVYSEISQPDKDHEFCYCTIHFYIDSNGLRAHISRRVLLNYETFYSPEFWKAEFRKAFDKLDRAI